MVKIKNFILIILIILSLDQLVENRSSLPDTTTAEFLQECAVYHNVIRRKHKAPDLKIRPWLIRYAMERLRKGSQYPKLKYGHKNLNETLGENIYWSLGKPHKMNCSEAIEKWYVEIKDYDFDKGLYSKKTGHFTQMVWIGSTEVGCARSMKPVGNKYEVYVDCIYALSGNYRGEFKENVKRSKDNADKVYRIATDMYKKLNKTGKLPTKRFAAAISDAKKGDKMLKNFNGEVEDEDEDDYAISSEPIKDLTAVEHCFDRTLLLRRIFDFNCKRTKAIRKELRKRRKNFGLEWRNTFDALTSGDSEDDHSEDPACLNCHH